MSLTVCQSRPDCFCSFAQVPFPSWRAASSVLSSWHWQVRNLCTCTPVTFL